MIRMEEFRALVRTRCGGLGSSRRAGPFARVSFAMMGLAILLPLLSLLSLFGFSEDSVDVHVPFAPTMRTGSNLPHTITPRRTVMIKGPRPTR